MSTTRLEAAGDSFRGHALLMTADELAGMLRASTRTVRRLDSAGRLPRAVKVGGLKRWRRVEITAWIAAGCPNRREWTWDGNGGEGGP